MGTSRHNSSTALPLRLDDVPLTGDRPPLVLTAFTRPDLLKFVIPAIQKQSLLPSKLIAYIDGARREADVPLIEQCIALLESCTSVFPVKVIRRNHNLGCDQNVIQAFTEVLEIYDSLVYLEDDTVPNPFFYDRMCRLLQAYRISPQICSISGYANLSNEYNPESDADFIVSNRVFSWGFATWRDRWKKFDLIHQSGQYNPFGEYYRIPATAQTKLTLINQFWIEKNHNTDWMITFTLTALFHQQYHLVPTQSLVCNIGFGHPESKTYRGEEPTWVNPRYDSGFCPNRLPSTPNISPTLNSVLKETEWIHYLKAQSSLWLGPKAFLELLKTTQENRNKLLLFQLFLARLPFVLKRWRGGLPT